MKSAWQTRWAGRHATRSRHCSPCCYRRSPQSVWPVHFHDTWLRGMENVHVSVGPRINRVDASAGGLGGCPLLARRIGQRGHRGGGPHAPQDRQNSECRRGAGRLSRAEPPRVVRTLKAGHRQSRSGGVCPRLGLRGGDKSRHYTNKIQCFRTFQHVIRPVRRDASWLEGLRPTPGPAVPGGVATASCSLTSPECSSWPRRPGPRTSCMGRMGGPGHGHESQPAQFPRHIVTVHFPARDSSPSCGESLPCIPSRTTRASCCCRASLCR